MRLLLAVLVACTPRGAAPVLSHAREGIAIALYDRGGGAAYSVVDDRRWVVLKDGTLVLDQIDPAATLASLVIEPLGDAALRIGACERDRIPDAEGAEVGAGDAGGRASRPPAGAVKPHPERYMPAVRCGVIGAPGRYLVRILYVSPAIAYRAQHDIAMVAPDRATVITRFAIATPNWRQRADVVVFDGAPGGERPPREVARGTATLDGSTAVITVAARELPAHVRRIYDGAVIGHDLPATDAMWGHDSQQAVWVWLEIPRLQLAPGPVHVHVEIADEAIRDVEVPAASRQEDAGIRMPLWIDETLRGMRQRYPDYTENAELAERFLLAIANTGDVAREVWIEEHVRPARRRRVERAWPIKPTAGGDMLRNKLTVRPGAVERVGYTLAYDF